MVAPEPLLRTLPRDWKLWPADGATLAGAGTEGPLGLRACPCPERSLEELLAPAQAKPSPCPQTDIPYIQRRMKYPDVAHARKLFIVLALCSLGLHSQACKVVRCHAWLLPSCCSGVIVLVLGELP